MLGSPQFPHVAWLILMALGLSGCKDAMDTVSTAQQTSPFLQKEKISRLQSTAQRSVRGALGCGIGTITIVRSDGTSIEAACDLDPIHVFGDRVQVSDLVPLLEARRKANETGQGLMAGDVEELCYVVISILGNSEDPTVVHAVAPLVNDPSAMIRRWAEDSMTRLSEHDPMQHR